jgi:3-oxoadipate enol-lactonase
MSFEGHVVLIHAFPLNATLWRPQVDRAADGLRFITPEYPGFGRSAEPPVRSMDDIARSMLQALDDAKVDRAVIGGMSMGGYVTLALYRMAPERFAGMILADTRATADNDQQREARRTMIATVHDRGATAVADEMLPKLLGATTQREQPELTTKVRAMIERNSPDAIAGAVEAMMGRQDSMSLLDRISVPTLIVCGAEDVLTPPADSEALHAGIAGSRLAILAGAGHLSNIESPDAFSLALNAFLAGVSTSH